jgi:hypothetical protein
MGGGNIRMNLKEIYLRPRKLYTGMVAYPEFHVG